MPKDARNITIKEGDEIYFNGCTCTVESIKESGLVGATALHQNKTQAHSIPGVIKVTMMISYNVGQPINNALVLGTPKDIDLLESKRRSQA